MSEAVKLVVDAYVKLNNREALEEIREHRHRMRRRLEEITGSPFDVSKLIRNYDVEIEIIEAGLSKLSA